MSIYNIEITSNCGIKCVAVCRYNNMLSYLNMLGIIGEDNPQIRGITFKEKSRFLSSNKINFSVNTKNIPKKITSIDFYLYKENGTIKNKDNFNIIINEKTSYTIHIDKKIEFNNAYSIHILTNKARILPPLRCVSTVGGEMNRFFIC